MDNNLLYLQQLALGASFSTTNRVLTSANNSETLLTSDRILFCNAEFSYMSVNLPDVSVMQGIEMKFINISNNYESSFTINGPFLGGSTYNLNTYGHSVTFISDSSTWWILQQYIP